MSARLINLTNAGRINVSFCSFDLRSKSAREFLRCLYGKKVAESNTKCIIRTQVKNDDSEPTIQVALSDGTKHSINTSNLKYSEVVDKFHAITGFNQ
ncbi:39S ribosomal protein L53, mitochondrial [Trichoplax sp. H2]|nr:39S ribosomal protein L53, mitochondrial [Trichoplax sp. H2]|eukprot:RDD41097.1 39S ribosomal protein L53, mitochondrial [Trichoplax sp. H2]